MMDVATALGTYLDIVDSVAPGLVEGLYVVGSYALGDWTEGTSDIDIVAVTAEPATDDDYGSLHTVHALLAEQPQPFIDGPYLAWGDLLIEPATGLHRPWVLDGRLRHDGECFEINPITWYTLATYGVTVRGPAVESLGIPIDIEARIRFVVDNLQGYWRGVADGVAAACARAEPPAFSAAFSIFNSSTVCFKRAMVPSVDSGVVRATAWALRTWRAACCSSFLPPAAAATCSCAGRLATVAAALMEMVPAFTASTSSGVADFWIFSIC